MQAGTVALGEVDKKYIMSTQDGNDDEALVRRKLMQYLTLVRITGNPLYPNYNRTAERRNRTVQFIEKDANGCRQTTKPLDLIDSTVVH
jgi:hypothetical protein